MYIANTTKQHYRPNFRVPESARVMFVDIQSGQQVQIGASWNPIQRDAVVAQLEKYGARPARDASGKLVKYDGLLYSFDRPITTDRIETGHAAVVAEQEDRSAKELAKAALAFDASQRTKHTRKRRARVTSLEVSTESHPHEKPTDDAVRFGITVDPNGHDNPRID